jgi:hypothetical protein
MLIRFHILVMQIAVLPIINPAEAAAMHAPWLQNVPIIMGAMPKNVCHLPTVAANNAALLIACSREIMIHLKRQNTPFGMCLPALPAMIQNTGDICIKECGGIMQEYAFGHLETAPIILSPYKPLMEAK